MICCFRTSFTPTEEELLDIQQRFSEEGSDSHLYIPENFTVTVPAHVDSEQVDYKAGEWVWILCMWCGLPLATYGI